MNFRRFAYRLIVVLALTAGVAAEAALAQLPVPALTGRIVDQTATLSEAQKASLEQTLLAFEAKKGTQFAVLIVPTTAPESIEQFSLRVAERWKIGRKKVDDGAILVVAKDDRAMRIEVGYGLEGSLTDVTVKRIISEVITPAFQKSDFAGGITAGIGRMISVADGESLPAPVPATPRQSGGAGFDYGQYVPIIFMLALVVGRVLRSVLGRLPGAVVTGGVLGVIAWFVVGAVVIAIGAGVIGFIFTLLGGMGGTGAWRSGTGGFGGGFGGFGGSGGGSGGFSGGGGSFGGGGASGRW